MGHGCPTIIMVNNVNVILTLLDGLQRDMPGSCPRCQRSIDGTDLLGASSAANERAPYLLQNAAVGATRLPEPRDNRVHFACLNRGPGADRSELYFFVWRGRKRAASGKNRRKKLARGLTILHGPGLRG
jgi:hypothetical protein